MPGKTNVKNQIALPIEERTCTLEDCEICQADLAFLRLQERPSYESLPNDLHIVDLFAGAGGLTLGVAEAARRFGRGISVRLAVDSDLSASQVFLCNFPQANTLSIPVEQVFDGELGARATTSEAKYRLVAGRVDILVGGPPCQGYSDLNNRTRRKDPRNRLYALMARASEVLKPKAVLIENVPSVIHDSEQVTDLVSRHLIQAGYQVATRLIDLSSIGVPQSRKRHVLLAVQKQIADPRLVLESLRSPCPHHTQRTVAWAIGDLAGQDGTTMFDSPSKPTMNNLRRIDWLFEQDQYDLPNELRPECHKSDHSYRSMYGRLRWDLPAQTITTGFGSMGQGRYVHPGNRRTLTPHEAARLQTFPDFFSFSAAGTRGGWARMIGNAVPPFLGIALGKLLIPEV